MKMWSLQKTLFILCYILSYLSSAATLIHVSGYEGREAAVFCSYGEGYESYQKYLCRGNCDYEDMLIESGNVKDRYSISDDRNKRIFTVTISDLRFADAGKYWCGVTRTGKDLYSEVKLEVFRDHCCDTVSTVQGYEEGSVSISCPYQKYQNNLKYLCRGSQPSTCLQQAVITSENNQSGRFSLHDDKVSRNFTVTISSLTQNDSGLYLCGTHNINSLDVFSAAKLEVKVDRCCDNVSTVQGYEGSPVSISCPYHSKYQNNLKYLCRGSQTFTCLQKAVITSDNNRSGQFSLHDDKVSRNFTVTISSLTQSDSGLYLCGIYSSNSLDVFSAAKLEVKVDRCCDNVSTVQGYEGSPVSISCPYHSKYQNNLKYLCRGSQPSTCLQKAAITSENNRSGRFSLHVDKVSRNFTVTISSLTQNDSGLYLCGIYSSNSLDVFSAAELEVNVDRCCDNVSTVQGYEGSPVSISCPYHSKYQNNLKYLCRGSQTSTCLQHAVITSENNRSGRFSLHDDKVSRNFTVTISSLTQSDSGLYLCGIYSSNSLDVFSAAELEVNDAAHINYVAVIVPVSLAVVLTVTLTLVCRCKGAKVRDAEASMSRNRSRTAEISDTKEDVARRKLDSSKQLNTLRRCDRADEEEQESEYQNVAAGEDIYCNQIVINYNKANRN